MYCKPHFLQFTWIYMRLIQVVFHLIISLHNYKLLPIIYKQGLLLFILPSHSVCSVVWPLRSIVLKCFKTVIFDLPERFLLIR